MRIRALIAAVVFVAPLQATAGDAATACRLSEDFRFDGTEKTVTCEKGDGTTITFHACAKEEAGSVRVIFQPEACGVENATEQVLARANLSPILLLPKGTVFRP